jgi:hypothetical protein
MEMVILVAAIIDVLAVAASTEAFRHRLAGFRWSQATQPEYPLMRPRSPPNEYPFSSSRSSLMFGLFVVWTGEHREYQDRRLTRYAWMARLTMLALPAIILLSQVAS